MNKKGVGIVGIIFLFIIFIILFFAGIGKFTNEIGHSAVQENNITGAEAYLLDNFAFIIIICMFLGMLAFMYFVGG